MRNATEYDTALSIPVTAELLEKQRNRLQRDYADAITALRRAKQACKEIGISEPEAIVSRNGGVSTASIDWRNVESARFPDEISAGVDVSMWRYAFKLLPLGRILPARDLSDLLQRAIDDRLPFSASGLQSLVDQGLRGSGGQQVAFIAGLFEALVARDWNVGGRQGGPSRHANPVDLGARFRVACGQLAVPTYDIWGWTWRHQAGTHQYTLTDLESAFSLLDGKGIPAESAIDARVYEVRFSRGPESDRNASPLLVGCEYFTATIYKNGNLKITVHRDDLLPEFNRIGGEHLRRLSDAAAS